MAKNANLSATSFAKTSFQLFNVVYTKFNKNSKKILKGLHDRPETEEFANLWWKEPPSIRRLFACPQFFLDSRPGHCAPRLLDCFLISTRVQFPQWMLQGIEEKRNYYFFSVKSSHYNYLANNMPIDFHNIIHGGGLCVQETQNTELAQAKIDRFLWSKVCVWIKICSQVSYF